MKLYSVNIKICATAYIHADTPEQAMQIARDMQNDCLEVREDWDGEVPITGAQYDDPDLPEVSLSPAMTIHGVFDDEEEAEEVHDFGEAFAVGDSVVILVEATGADHEDIEHTIGAGAIGKIDSIDGDAYTVVIPVDAGDERHIVNVFDEEDGPITAFLAHEEESDAVS
jgi:ribosomal protein L21E